MIYENFIHKFEYYTWYIWFQWNGCEAFLGGVKKRKFCDCKEFKVWCRIWILHLWRQFSLFDMETYIYLKVYFRQDSLPKWDEKRQLDNDREFDLYYIIFYYECPKLKIYVKD